MFFTLTKNSINLSPALTSGSNQKIATYFFRTGIKAAYNPGLTPE